MTSISILGSTGSIGTQTLEVAKWRGFRVVGLAAGRNLTLAIQQARDWQPELLSVDESILLAAREALPQQKIVADASEVAVLPADVVVGAIPGLAGLEPTRAALAAGRNVALANKEAMVCGGSLIWQIAHANHAKITPVDSEHSALYQCLVGERLEDVAELILTASGGPFRDAPEDLSAVTPEMALKHPNWVMGAKVTIDSSTLMNKGLEVLEAHYLYQFPLEQIGVLIQPGSIIHSMVRFKDNQIKAQLGAPDMRLPIQYAILAALETLGIEFPGAQRPPTPLAPLNLVGNLELRAVNHARFPCLGLAYEAGRKGGVAPVALNAADEIAVEAFLAHKLPYLGIPKLIEAVLQEAPSLELSWENITQTDAWARTRARELVGGL